MDKILVIGAGGQLGTDLTVALRKKYSSEAVIASDVRPVNAEEGPFIQLDVMNNELLERTVEEHGITQIYHLAAILSAKGEENPLWAWDLNMRSLLNVLELGRKGVKKIYWPSSIAVFGPDTPKTMTPQVTTMNPNTVYGISKLAGERWCEYYFNKYGVDVRSLRYPGLIGYKALPGGGTTDYAVDIFYKAVAGETYNCFLSEDAMLPMMFMDDAVKATIDLMEAETSNISVRSSYNVAGLSFTPEEVFSEIRKHLPNFQIDYNPDFRQDIADSWPNSIDDSFARKDWGWSPSFDLSEMTKVMLENIQIPVS